MVRRAMVLRDLGKKVSKPSKDSLNRAPPSAWRVHHDGSTYWVTKIPDDRKRRGQAELLFTYLARELRRRHRQALLVAIGLAVGIGLVITVSAASSGVKVAQGEVLHSLYGVGTDITLTQTTSGAPSGEHFGGFGGAGSAPSSGTTINRTALSTVPGSGSLAASSVTRISHLHDVNAVTESLALQETHVSGTIPSTGSGFDGSGAGGGALNISSTSITGVQPSDSGLGPLSPSEIIKGKYFSTTGAVKDAIVSSSYASQENLAVGSSLSLDGTTFKVIGVADVPSSSASSADVYLTLSEAQSLSGDADKVTTVYVSATSASDVSSAQHEIQSLFPHATVTTSASLANEVTGSLSSAASLADTLGKWLAIIVLIAAFLVAALLMMAAVSRRVREFGTLKAIGWRTRRVVEQVMSEGVAIGIVGGVVGIILGVVGAEIVSAFFPSLTANVGLASATGTSGATGGGGFTGGAGSTGGAFSTGGSSSHRPGIFSDLTHTVIVHLSAPIQGDAIGLAIGLAIAGGLLAGGIGAWRAARLRPAAALRNVA